MEMGIMRCCCGKEFSPNSRGRFFFKKEKGNKITIYTCDGCGDEIILNVEKINNYIPNNPEKFFNNNKERVRYESR